MPHNWELYNFNSSAIIVEVIKSKTTRWAGHVTRMRWKCIYNFGRKTERKRPSGISISDSIMATWKCIFI
jgi:hypothetical protein